MATKRSVILQGDPIINEENVAVSAIKPGHLVKTPVAGAAVQSGTGWVPKTLALERDELGTGFDDTYRQTGTISAYYASGDVVKVATFASGQRATGYIASGQNIQQDELLESAGDGTFKSGSTNPIAKSLDEVGAVTVLTALRVEFL
jgi:hypothetical protein